MYIRMTGTQRKALARGRVRYAHVSVAVGWKVDGLTGVLVPTRTPEGKGSTAKRAERKRVHGRSTRRRMDKAGYLCGGCTDGSPPCFCRGTD